MLGIIKLIFGVMLVFFGLTLIAGFGWLLLASALVADKDSQQAISIVFIGYAVWYILDLIFVPLGISLDNRKKLAIMQGGSQAQEKITAKSVGKSVLNIAIGVIVVIGVLILAGVVYAFLLS